MKLIMAFICLVLPHGLYAYGTDDGPGGMYYGGDATHGLYFNVAGNYSSRGSDRMLCEKIDAAREDEELYEPE